MNTLFRVLLLSWGFLLLVTVAGTGQESQSSRKTLERAAAQGSPPAQYALGIAAEAEGRFSDAVAWYRRAADQDYALAQFKLGQLLEAGRGVEPDGAQAQKWLEKAAAHGVTSGTDVPSSSKAPLASVPTPSVRGSSQAVGKIAIFVGPQTRDGFVDVDSGVIDSIRDIQNELKRSSQFVVVDTAEKATIVLVIVGRRLSGNGGAVGITTPGTTIGGGTIAGVQQPTFTTPGVTTMIPIDRHAIDTVLRVGTYERAIASEQPNGAGWASVAKVVVKDVTAWLEANRAALNLRPK